MNDLIAPLPSVPDGLREAAQRGMLIPFIGAGVSRIAGCPSWGEFADGALRFFVDEGKFSHGQLAQINHLNPRVVERLVLAFLWGDEELETSRFAALFETDDEQDLEVGSAFFSGVHNDKLSDDQVERIIRYWERCVAWARRVSPAPAKLLASLSHLVPFIKSIGRRERQLLLAVAPYAHKGHRYDLFFAELERLVDAQPHEVSEILNASLESHLPDYDYDDRLKSLLTKMAAKGRKSDAIGFAERLRRNIPGMLQLYTSLKSDQE